MQAPILQYNSVEYWGHTCMKLKWASFQLLVIKDLLSQRKLKIHSQASEHVYVLFLLNIDFCWVASQ